LGIYEISCVLRVLPAIFTLVKHLDQAVTFSYTDIANVSQGNARRDVTVPPSDLSGAIPTDAASQRTAEPPLFVLAYDHRSVLRQMLVRDRRLDVDEAVLRQTKDVVLDGLLAALDDGLVPRGIRAGLLVDEELGASAAIRAHQRGVELIMPLERSGAPTFTVEYGQDFLDHLQAFPIDYAKALAFLNPAHPSDRYRGQLELMADVLGTVAAAGYQMMLEVIIPATDEQLAALDGDAERFDRELRPMLVCQTIADCYASGIRPALWKLEGLETSGDYAMVTDVIAAADPAARSLVLGRGADTRRVMNWVTLAARTPGFAGFAIGRSIWEGALSDWLTGATGCGAAVRATARQYAQYVNHYLEAERELTGFAHELAAGD
jgi:myo-inositol catabolism protein IolC